MKTYQVNEDFILEAHASACAEWKKKIEEAVPDLFPEIKLRMGSRIKYRDGDEYIITRTGGAQERIIAINIKDGNLWGEGIPRKLLGTQVSLSDVVGKGWGPDFTLISY